MTTRTQAPILGAAFVLLMGTIFATICLTHIGFGFVYFFGFSIVITFIGAICLISTIRSSRKPN
jgi:hypothetical protein